MYPSTFDKNLKYGTEGEGEVIQVLGEKGWQFYVCAFDGSHPIDTFAFAPNGNLYALDIKTHIQRDFYPDNGFNYSQYLKYKELEEKYNIPIIILFNDSKLGEIYGGLLSELEKERSVKYKGKILKYPMKVENTRYGELVIFFPYEACEIYAKKGDDINGNIPEE